MADRMSVAGGLGMCDEYSKIIAGKSVRGRRAAGEKSVDPVIRPRPHAGVGTDLERAYTAENRLGIALAWICRHGTHGTVDGTQCKGRKGKTPGCRCGLDDMQKMREDVREEERERVEGR